MIQTQQAAEVISTAPTTGKVTMGIRHEDMGKVMGLLTDIYKNKLAAVIREYSTNAIDAIIAAGLDPTKNPIRVTLPTALTPFLTIADCGVGLSEDDINNIYANYGYSTKDATNDATGMFGIGCKSALTYTQQFTVQSVKNGKRIVVIVSRESDGSGSMNTISETPTDDPNGTEIKVAIRREDHHRAEQIAKDFYSYWYEGSVLVNGQRPKRFDGLRISDDLFVTQKHHESKVVMGNVAYPVAELDDLCPMGSVVAYVPIGSCEIPPARESLQESKATTESLDRLREQFVTEAHKAVQREIDKATTPAEALKLAVQWDRYLPGGGRMPQRARPGQSPLTGYKFKGSDLPAYIESDTEVEMLDNTGKLARLAKPSRPFITSGNGSYRIGVGSAASRIYSIEWPQAVWVVGYTPTKFNANHKRKLRMAAEAKGLMALDIDQFVCVPGPMPDATKQPGVAFIDPARILDWEDVRKLQLQPRASRGGSTGRIPGSYDLYTEGGNDLYGSGTFTPGVPGDKIRRNQPILYFQGNRYQYRGRLQEAVAACYSKYTVVLLTANRVDKFKRNVPEAKTITEGITKKRDEWIKALTKDQRDALWLSDAGLIAWSKHLDGRKVKDPALKRVAALANMNLRPLLVKCRVFGNIIDIRIESKLTNPFTRYPLYNPAAGAPQDHLHDYLNWAYEANK
jgi:hypothetical protein